MVPKDVDVHAIDLALHLKARGRSGKLFPLLNREYEISPFLGVEGDAFSDRFSIGLDSGIGFPGSHHLAGHLVEEFLQSRSFAGLQFLDLGIQKLHDASFFEPLRSDAVLSL